MHVSGPPSRADSGHRWPIRGPTASGRGGSSTKLRLNHNGVIHLLLITDVMTHTWKRHGLQAAIEVLEAKKIGPG